MRIPALVKDITRLATAAVTAQAILTLGVWFVAKELAPSDFGKYSVFIAYCSIFALSGAFKYENAFLLVNRTIAGSNLTALVALVCLLNGVAATALFVLVFGKPLHLTIEVSPFVFLTVFGQALAVAFLVHRIARGDVGLVASTRLSRAVITVIVWVVGLHIFLDRPEYALYWGAVAGAWFANNRLVRVAAKRAWRNRKLVRKQRIVALAKRYRKYPLLEAPSFAARNLGRNGQVFLAAILFGPVGAGLVGLSNLLVTRPLSIVVLSVGRSMQRRHAIAVKSQDARHTAQLGLKYLLALFGLACVVSLGVAVAAPMLLPIILANRWEGISQVVLTVVPRLFGLIVVGALTMLLSVEQRQKEILVLEIATVGVTYGAFVAGYFIFEDLIRALWMSSLASLGWHTIFVASIARDWRRNVLVVSN